MIDEIGYCNVCSKPFDGASRSDHCTRCNNCLEHCEDREVHAAEEAADEEIGNCDVCDKAYDTASRSDHCAECGNCFEHCPDREDHARTLATEEAEAMGMSEDDAAEYIAAALEDIN